jgi:hypothetical protein
MAGRFSESALDCPSRRYAVGILERERKEMNTIARIRAFALFVFLLVSVTPFCRATNVTWTVTITNTTNENHVAIAPANAGSNMATLVSQARNYLIHNPSNTLTLFFPKNTYIFTNTASRGIMLNSFNFTNQSLILSGAGPDLTKLVFCADKLDGLYINQSINVTVEKMHLTHLGYGSSFPYSVQGTVCDVTNSNRPTNEVWFTVHDGFPDPVTFFLENTDNERVLIGFDGSGSNVLDPKLLPYKKVLLQNLYQISGSKYCAVLEPQWYYPPIPFHDGDWVALKVKYGADTLKLSYTTNCTANELLFTCAAGRAIAAINYNDGLKILKIRVDRPDPVQGKGVCLSGPGGAVVIYSGLVAPTIEDCVMVATADDPIAVVPSAELGTNQLPSNGLIDGNTARDTPRGCYLCSSDQGLCYDNLFIRNMYAALTIKNESSAFNKPNWAVKNWSFYNNLFVDSGVDPVVALMTETTGDGKHTNLLFHDNIILQAPHDYPIFEVDNSTTITIQSNIIASFSAAAEGNLDGTSNALLSVIQGNVSGIGNTYEQPLVPTGRPVELPANTNFNWTYNSTSDLTNVTFNSVSNEDGFTVESGEGTDVGGSFNATLAAWGALQAGDNSSNERIRSILSFDTSSLPDGAKIVSATLRLRRGNVVGTDPFTTKGFCYVDVKGGSGFNNNTALSEEDFQAPADLVRVATMSAPANNLDWSEGQFTAGLNKINTTNTQLRVYFLKADTDTNGLDDLMCFYSGECTNSTYRPQLVIVYRNRGVLKMIVPPTVALQILAGHPLLSLNGMLSSNYTVQYLDDLTATNWLNLLSISNLSVTPYQFFDPAESSRPARFYRAIMQ